MGLNIGDVIGEAAVQKVRRMFLCYWSILLLLAAIVLGSAGSTGSGWGQLQYSVEYLDHKVMIAVERITASPHQVN